MDIYKKGTREGVRFNTSRGVLTIEQLFQLPLAELATSVRNVKKSLKKNDDDDLGFLDATTKVDETEQLRFDILKDVYITRKAELEEARTKREAKENNQKILALIAEKKEGELKGKSIEELEKMLVEV